MQPLVVPARFNGPPTSGNGGWVSGRLAALLDPAPGEAVQVVLRSPPPLEVPLQVQRGADGGLSAWSGDAPVASANRVPSPFAGPAPAAASFDAAQAAGARYAGARDHPFPTCFVCGPDRQAGDGLRLTPGRLDDRPAETVAAWVPDASLADDGTGQVDVAACWAALDCPGGWALDLTGRPMVLGTMTAQVRALPHVGGRYVVVGRALDAGPAGAASRKGGPRPRCTTPTRRVLPSREPPGSGCGSTRPPSARSDSREPALAPASCSPASDPASCSPASAMLHADRRPGSEQRPGGSSADAMEQGPAARDTFGRPGMPAHR